MQLVIIFGTMHVVKKAGLESPEYAPLIRAAYGVTTAAILGLTFYMKGLIAKRNDTTALEYDDATPGSQNERVVTTVAKYDASEVAKLQKSTLFTLAIVVFMHFKFGYIQPLILQSLLPILNLYKNPLFQIHILGKPATDSLKRPWVPENPFAAFTGAGNRDAPAAIATAAGAGASAASDDSEPAAPANNKSSETRKDK
ncbi:phosphate transporter (Pho88) [Coemansia nantahalensis]|uniref:Phosphate transporter (Pho88) n=2 Tax=Coemansia TaxID=4863 RepID=A0ACC1LHH1_9FUNG|nr:phosphate transporter (Pho88) [Coemansia nantahalensis]KAJ2808227.1 phosphate transporter (Pho88) [Coemansia helicoidea]